METRNMSAPTRIGRYRKKLRMLFRKRRKSAFQESHLGIEERWTIIARHLPDRKSWILDVGSNLGDTARRAAEIGHIVVGVESEKHLVQRAIEMVPPKVALMTGTVDPDFFRSMPRFDVVFLLSVVHRIWAVKGRRFAEECLTACLGKTDRIIIEGAVRHERYTQYGKETPEFESNNLAAGIDWHTEWLVALARPGDWEVKYLGYVPHSVKEPHRPLFLLSARGGRPA